jgi:hypothetical protein
MEIYLDKRAVKQIRLSTADAIEEGDIEALKQDIFESFPEERLVTLEQLTGGSDFMEVLTPILDDWSGDDIDELFELLESALGDHGVDLKYHSHDEDEFDDGDDFNAAGAEAGAEDDDVGADDDAPLDDEL